MNNVVYMVVVLVILVLSMTLHEAMHAFASYWLGDNTARLEGRLTLNPFKHLDLFLSIFLPLILAITGAPIFGGAKPVPINTSNIKYNEWGIALVALAGPFMNLIIAFVAFGLYVTFGMNSENVLLILILMTFIRVNLGFFVFNMIPIPPLDGSRFMYALAPDFIRRLMESAEKFGIWIIFGIIILGGSLVGEIIQAVVNFFITIFSLFFSII